MIPWLQIDTTRVPGADVELRLMRRGAEFSMMLGQNELMNSRLSGSEEALATLACRRIDGVKSRTPTDISLSLSNITIFVRPGISQHQVIFLLVAYSCTTELPAWAHSTRSMPMATSTW